MSATKTRARLLSPLELDAWRGFLRVHAALTNELDAELTAAHGLPLSWYEVLLLLALAPEGRMRMSELADSALLSRSGLTRLVDRLERDGLLERVRCEEDARGLYAVVTARGRAVFEAARATHLDGVRRRFLDQIEPAELGRLGALWKRLAPDG
jgi:DNA-binding MarR family transcriptional regulator